MDPLLPFAFSLGAFGAGGVLAAFAPTRRSQAVVGGGALVLGGLLALASALAALGAGASADLVLGAPAPPLLALHLRVDALAGFAMLALAIVAVPVGLGLPAYLARARLGSARLLPAMLCALMLSILLVVTARHAVALLLAWETMSLVGYFLVVAGEDASTRQASQRYFVLAHLTGALLFTSFSALFALTGSFELDAYARLPPSPLATVAFACALAGLATKAGLIPFHGWLPPAYRAAPAPASAAMSGIMSKVAVFLLLRFVVELLAPGPAWWGYLTLGLGSLSMLVGILYALQEDDLKRLLAYSSIENLGLVFAAIGLGQLLLSHDLPTLALLAFAAALLHTVNHAAYKTLLFLASGHVENEARTLDLDKLGGLATRMRWTSAFFLVGALAICALPPLNGFVSEWLLYQGLVGAVHAGPGALATTAALAVMSVLALSGGLAVATFVKAQGVAFHALPRSPEAAQARDPPTSALVAMAIPAALCVALALLAPILLAHAQLHFATSLGVAPDAASTEPMRLAIAPLASALAPLAILVSLATLAALPLLALRRRPAPTGPVWACGYRATRARAGYTSLAMAKPLRMLFSTILLPDRVLTRTPTADALRPGVRLASRVTPVVERFLYDPLANGTLLLSARLRVLQQGSVRVYISYILVVLVALITYVSVAP